MMGKNIAPAAVLDINSVINVPTKQMAVITTIGLVPHTSRIPMARRSAIPVFWIASPSTTLPANTINMSQLIARMAWSGVQQCSIIMAAAAIKAQCSSGIIPKADTVTIAIIISADISVLLPTLITSSPTCKPRSWASCSMSLICPAYVRWSPPITNSFLFSATGTLSKCRILISRPPFTSYKPA